MTHLHISFTTPDLDASTRFYRALFDLSPDKEEAGYVRFTLAEPPLVLSLRTGAAAPLGHGIDHLGLRLDDATAVRAAHARLQAAGLAEELEESVRCCYAVQDKTWVQDPDGRPWEVYTVLADDTVLIDPETTCCPSTEASAPADPAAPGAQGEACCG